MNTNSQNIQIMDIQMTYDITKETVPQPMIERFTLKHCQKAKNTKYQTINVGEAEEDEQIL